MTKWRGMLDQLVRERGRALYGFAFAMVGDRDEAEDLLQDALVRVFRRPRAVTSIDAAHAYVKRAITTASIDRARRASVRPRQAGVDSESWASTSTASATPDHAPDAIQTLDLRAALMTLSPRERACVLLRFMEDMTVDDVAETLDIAPGTAKRYLHDAVARLRKTWPDLHFDEHDTVDVSVRDGGTP